jgi:hypothetical protein
LRRENDELKKENELLKSRSSHIPCLYLWIYLKIYKKEIVTFERALDREVQERSSVSISTERLKSSEMYNVQLEDVLVEEKHKRSTLEVTPNDVLICHAQ